jgi:uncharacterized membrane protein
VIEKVLPPKMDSRIRASAVLVILGLLIETVTLFRNTPGSFLAFAFAGVACVILGIALFLISLVTVRTPPER